MHIAIIGAGPSGLVSARHAVSKEFDCTCEIFEQNNQIGGTWIYDERNGVDELNVPIHTSMYKNLITNLPKEVMNYPDFKFPTYRESFLKQEKILKYLNDYTENYDLKQFIHFRHIVKHIKPHSNNQWLIRIENAYTKNETEKIFDAVMICVGCSTPHIPANLIGKDVFKGKQIHSHSYRTPDIFHNQTVLVIGAGPSAVDITEQLVNHGIKIILSFKKWRMKADVSVKVIKKPNTIELTENCAIFEDGSIEKIDAILYCTGYDYKFPFLSPECGIIVDENFVQSLYKHIINIKYPTMAFIGLQKLSLTFPLFDYQARFFLKHLTNQIKLPSAIEMQNDTDAEMAERWQKGYPKNCAHFFGFDYQEKYFDDLANMAELQPLPRVIFKIFAEVLTKRDLISNYKILDNETFVKTTD